MSPVQDLVHLNRTICHTYWRSCCFSHQQHFLRTVVVFYMLIILKLNYIVIALQDTTAALKHITQKQQWKKKSQFRPWKSLCNGVCESEIFGNIYLSNIFFGGTNLECSEDKRKLCHTSQSTIHISDHLPLVGSMLVLAEALVLHILSRCERTFGWVTVGNVACKWKTLRSMTENILCSLGGMPHPAACVSFVRASSWWREFPSL